MIYSCCTVGTSDVSVHLQSSSAISDGDRDARVWCCCRRRNSALGTIPQTALLLPTSTAASRLLGAGVVKIRGKPSYSVCAPPPLHGRILDFSFSDVAIWI